MAAGEAPETRRLETWQAPPPADIRWTRLGEDYVAYHRPSGKTHLLNAASAVLIRDILSTPKSAPAAAEALAELQSADVDAGFLAEVTGHLRRFEELGLIQCV